MKASKRLLWVTLTICIALGGSTGAQTAPDSAMESNPTHLGLQLGANSSHFTGISSVPWNSRFGPYFGAYATYDMNDLLALQMELAYASKGARIEEAMLGTAQSRAAADIRLAYVQWTVLARVDPPVSRYEKRVGFRPKLLAGFALGTRVSTSIRGFDNDGLNFNDTELSLIFGGGFDYPAFGPYGLAIDFRFALGLSDIHADWKNNSASLLVGIFM